MKEKNNLEKKRSGIRILLVALIIICLLALGIALWLTFGKASGQVEEPEATTEPATEVVIVEETQSVEPETEVYVPLEQTVTISLAGDCSIGKLQIHGYEGTVWQYYDLYGSSYFFENVYDVFANDSMTLVNFEGVLTESDDRVEKTYNIKGRPEFIDVLPNASIECVTFGNNHRIDYGEQGVNDTIACFEQENITWAYDDNLAIYETPEGVKVGYVSVNAFGNAQSETYLENGIASLKEQGADIIIAACHWGIEGDHYPCDYQTSLGHKLIDWGVDLVVGSHPHVLQGFEYYNGHYIIYSLGNFCFGGNKNPTDKNTMIVQMKVNFVDGERVGDPELSVIPCRLSGHDSYNDYSPIIAEGSQRDTIIEKLNNYSSYYGVFIDADGNLIPVEPDPNAQHVDPPRSTKYQDEDAPATPPAAEPEPEVVGDPLMNPEAVDPSAEESTTD